MIDDPVQDLIDLTKRWSKRLLLSLLNEDSIMVDGDPMQITKTEPNKIVTTKVAFIERLDSEPNPRRVAQLNRRSRERKLQKQLAGAFQFCASLLASSHHN